MILSDTINQRYRYNTKAKTPTQIQQELRKLGVNGFVVKVAGSRVTMLVSENDIKRNRECVGMGNSIDHKSKEYYELQSDIWFNECCKRMKERDAYKKQRDELINDMAETKRKAEAFDEIDDLIVNGTLKDREPNAIFQNICHVIINLKERGSDE